MVATYGMSDSIGPVSYECGQEVFIGRDYEKTKPYSEQTAGQIDAQVQVIMREAYSAARKSWPPMRNGSIRSRAS